MHLKILSEKLRPFCLGLNNVLLLSYVGHRHRYVTMYGSLLTAIAPRVYIVLDMALFIYIDFVRPVMTLLKYVDLIQPIIHNRLNQVNIFE